MKRLGNALGNFLTAEENEVPVEMSLRTSRMTMRKDLVLRLVLKGLEAGNERQTGLQQRGELAGEKGQLAEVELVGLGFLLEGLLLGHCLSRPDIGLGFRRRCRCRHGGGNKGFLPVPAIPISPSRLGDLNKSLNALRPKTRFPLILRL